MLVLLHLQINDIFHYHPNFFLIFFSIDADYFSLSGTYSLIMTGLLLNKARVLISRDRLFIQYSYTILAGPWPSLGRGCAQWECCRGVEERTHAHSIQAVMNVVLDTNCLLMSLSRRSSYYPVADYILQYICPISWFVIFGAFLRVSVSCLLFWQSNRYPLFLRFSSCFPYKSERKKVSIQSFVAK